ncbi:MAG: hydrogenase maturation protease [Dehalogenimonas sp.]|jgi:hydrogenase maturation protease|uniref:Hydrogenase maturation protease n=1 Tax=Candidatus Dehalogenimonas loeffleri TaxID=3127115 RepID=A0ABZ2J6D8_9CHLR|nr:hydrogenase maturation protease [Dehalogenimonas sp.]
MSSQSETKTEQTLILGIGNVIMSDEGFGIHVLRDLKQYTFPDHIRLHDGAVAGFDLLGYLEGVERLVIVDVMITDLEPGEIGWMEMDARFNAPNKTDLSFHQIGIIELLQIAELIGYKPRVQFLVTRPEKLEWGFELTPKARQAADKAVAYLVENFNGRPAANA